MLKMLNYVITVPTASDALLGREGENNARTLRVKTTDDLSAYATVNLLIDTLDCGDMTVTETSNYNVLSLTLTSEMLGDAGTKTCQLLMMGTDGTVILKSNQFLMEVKESNDVESAVSDSSTVVIISEHITEQVADAMEEAFADGTELAQIVQDWCDENASQYVTLETGSVTTDTIASGAVTYEKLDSELRDSHKSTLTNLLETTLPSVDRNGLTYTRSEDGTYTITGTAEQNTYLALGVIVLPAGTYKFVGLTSSGSSSTFKVNLYSYETSAVIATDIGNGCEFELSAETTVRVVPYIYSGTNVNITIKPFISTSREITVDDYVPYLYDETDLNKNVALLKNDLSSYKLGGERIKNNNVGWMYDVAKSWIDNASSIYYQNENNLFWDDIVMSEDNRYPMSCSVFVMAFAFGISFYDSRYNGLSENAANGLAYTDDALLESLKNGFDSASILKYFLGKGYAYYPTDDMSDVQTGDILFYDLDTSNDSATGHFMGIDHSSIFAYFSPTDSAKYYVWEVGGDAGPVPSQKTVNPDTLIIAVRLPYRGMLKNSKSVTLSGGNFASPVLLSDVINLSNNGAQGMWKIVLSGSAYSRGASASSIYLVRANSSGIPTDVVALYEGTYSAVRKISYISGDAELNDGYYIIDASESYNQNVTIHAEFICA